MIKMPLAEIIEKIKEEGNVSEEVINQKIEDKMKQLSGLISKEGAAHIIANEYGVNLFTQVSGKLQIKNILVGMRDVETVGKAQQVSQVNEFQRKDGSKGKVASFLLADETGSVRIALWGAQADIAPQIKEGNVVKILGGYVRENRGTKEVHINENSKVILNPKDETVGEVKVISNRKSIKDLAEADNDAEIFGTIVQVFEPRFFEICPQCGKRARQKDNSFFCEVHNVVEPSHSYVLTLFMDDGTESIRTVFFRNQLNNLLNKSPEEILAYKEDIQKFDEIKKGLVGNQIKIVGRVKKNEMFNRLEFTAQRVFPNPDPGEEIKRLKDEAAVSDN